MSSLKETLAELRRLIAAPPTSWEAVSPKVETAMEAMEQATKHVMDGVEVLNTQDARLASRQAAVIVRSLELATVAWEKVEDAVKGLR